MRFRSNQPNIPQSERERDIFDTDEVPHFGARVRGRKPWAPGTPQVVGLRNQPHTRKWQDDEFIYLDEKPYIYTVEKDIGTVVHFPGGGSMLLRDNFVRRCRISGPRVLRLDDLYEKYLRYYPDEEEADGEAPSKV